MDMVPENTCKERRISVDEKIQRHEKWLGEHEVKIDALEKSDATNTNEIKNLCKCIDIQNSRMGRLTTAIWGLVVSVFALLAGFFVWYIQSLPRG
jgi:hypothetical protein